MIIVKFRGKHRLINNFELGVGAYISTLGVMYVIEGYKNLKKRRRRRALKSLTTVLNWRGGGKFVRGFLGKRLKKGTQYEVVNPRLVRYILELTNSLDSPEVVYIDLELLAYALKTMKRPRPSEWLSQGFFVRIINPIRTTFAVVSGSISGVIMKLKGTQYSIICSIVFMIFVYFAPYHQYHHNMLNDLPVNNENIEYILKDREVGKIIVSMDNSTPECKIYEMEGNTFTSKDSKSIVVEHKPAKKEYKFNRRIRTLKDLSKKITSEEYNDAKDDAAYVRSIKEREAIRIKIPNKKRDSE